MTCVKSCKDRPPYSGPHSQGERISERPVGHRGHEEPQAVFGSAILLGYRFTQFPLLGRLPSLASFLAQGQQVSVRSKWNELHLAHSVLASHSKD